MPTSIIGALRVQLGLDSAQFVRGSADAERRAYQMGERIGKALRSPVDAAVSLKGALAGIATGATVAAFTAAAQRAFDFTDAIVDLADRTGASTKAIQEFRYAAQLSGSSVEAADGALEKFARTQGLAQAGSDSMVKLFRSLGVTSTDFDTALRQAMDGLQRLPTVQQRNAVALQLFGRSAASLTQLLGQGSKGFDDLASEAQRLGIVLQDDVLRNAGQANDTLDRMKMILNAQFANAVAKNAGSIVSLADGVTRLTSSLLTFMSQNPERALAIIGALSGGAAGLAVGGPGGGLIGATAGAISGYAAGGQISQGRFARNKKWMSLKKLEDDASAAEARFLRQGASRSTTNRFAAIRNKARRDRATLEAGLRDGSIKTDAALQSTGPSTAGAGLVPTVGNSEAAAARTRAGVEAKAAAREAARRAEEARRNEERFRADEFRAENERQDVQADLTASAAERLQFERNRFDRERAFNVQAIQADADLTAAQKAKLIGIEQEIAAGKTELSYRQERELIAQQELERARARSDSEAEILQAQAGLVRTAKERREIELRILKAQFAQLRLAQQAVIASENPDVTAADKAEARKRLGDLDRLEGLSTQQVERDNQGPIGRLLNSVPRNAAEMNEALESVAAGGIASIIDGLAEAGSGAKSLADVFKDTANDIIRQLLRIAIQQAVIGPLTKALFPNATPVAGARAEGGSVVGGRNYFVGERGVELFTPSTSGRIVANDDLLGSGRRGGDIHQHFSVPVGTGLVSRDEMFQFGGAVKTATLEAMRQGNMRRG